MSPQELIIYLNKLNIKFKRKYNERTFILDNNNYINKNMIVLFITKDGFRIILCTDKILFRQEDFKLADNIYAKYNYFKQINRFYNDKS